MSTAATTPTMNILCARSLGLGPRLVLAYLVQRGNGAPVVAQNAVIATDLGLSKDTIVEYLKALHAQRFIELTRWENLPPRPGCGKQPLTWRVQILKR
jgi:hypothetical protein